MLNNYYTLIHLVKSFQKIIGCKIIESFSQEKDSFVIIFSDGTNEFPLIFSSLAGQEAIYIRSTFNRAKANTTNIFPEINGEYCQNVYLAENDRVIYFELQNSTLVFTFFSGKNNAYVINGNGFILNSLNQRAEFVNSKLDFGNKPTVDFSRFPSDTNIQFALSRNKYFFGNIYAKLICREIGLEGNKSISTLDSISLQQISFYQEKLQNELISSEKYYLYEIDNKFILSLIKLNIEAEIIQEFDDINFATNKTYTKNLIDHRFAKLFKQYNHIITREISKIEKLIFHFKNEELIFDRGEKYKTWADVMISQPKLKIRLSAGSTFTDWNGEIHEIKLNEKLTLLENANVFYSKSKKAFDELENRIKRLPELEKQLENLQSNLEELQKIVYLDDLKKFSFKLSKYLRLKMQDKETKQADKFRSFDLGDGFTVFVGKNASNNDELTMKFAKPNDLWLHARGSSGSHAVVKLSSATKPPKHILTKAAEITAYYSGARNAKYVPVCYTFKKFVRKPKGANIGAVVISKEEIIMVEPKLPEGSVE